LITDAPESPDRQRHSREARYLTMMGLRAVCLVAAAIIASNKPPLWGLWVSLCVVGMVILPWMAVLVANDRPPKPQYRAANWLHRHRSEDPTPTNALPAPRHDVVDPDDAADQHDGPARPRVIDLDE
jgi:hypothetical protein